jgi:hypothetical protein
MIIVYKELLTEDPSGRGYDYWVGCDYSGVIRPTDEGKLDIHGSG